MFRTKLFRFDFLLLLIGLRRHRPTTKMEPSNEEYNRKLLKPLLQRKLATGNPIRSKNDHLHYDISDNPKVKKVEQVPWSTGLFGCFSDFRNCCITCWCPWITFGQIAEVVDEGTTSCARSGALYAILELAMGGGFLYTCLYRHHIRQQYAVEEGHCNDCLVHFFCKPCALCQEYRELQFRGFDPSLGWQGNVEEIGHGELEAPTPPVIGAEKTSAE